jgi:hypothetical protein
MSKLYILIFLSSNLVGTIGPLPYDMPECLERAADKMAAINSDAMKREVARVNDLELKCEFHQERPKLSDGTEGVKP